MIYLLVRYIWPNYTSK